MSSEIDKTISNDRGIENSSQGAVARCFFFEAFEDMKAASKQQREQEPLAKLKDPIGEATRKAIQGTAKSILGDLSIFQSKDEPDWKNHR